MPIEAHDVSPALPPRAPRDDDSNRLAQAGSAISRLTREFRAAWKPAEPKDPAR